MARVPSNRWTPKDVLSVVRELCKTVDQRTVLQEQGKYYYNLSLSEIVALLNSSTDPSYFKSEVVTVGSDISFMEIKAAGGINIVESIVASTNTIKKFDGVGNVPWEVGSLIDVSMMNTGTLAVYAKFLARITSVSTTGTPAGTTAIYSIIAGSDADWPVASTVGSCTIVKTLSNLTIDLTTLSKDYDTVVALIDSSNGLCVPVSLDVFHSIGRDDFSHKSYDDNIIFAQSGNTLYIRNGANVVAGTKTIVFQRQPDYPVLYSDAEWVDLGDKHIPLLAKRIYTYIILQTENDIPHNLAQEMALDYQQVSAYVGAENMNRSTKGMEKKK